MLILAHIEHSRSMYLFNWNCKLWVRYCILYSHYIR